MMFNFFFVLLTLSVTTYLWNVGFFFFFIFFLVIPIFYLSVLGKCYSHSVFYMNLECLSSPVISEWDLSSKSLNLNAIMYLLDNMEEDLVLSSKNSAGAFKSSGLLFLSDLSDCFEKILSILKYLPNCRSSFFLVSSFLDLSSLFLFLSSCSISFLFLLFFFLFPIFWFYASFFLFWMSLCFQDFSILPLEGFYTFNLSWCLNLLMIFFLVWLNIFFTYFFSFLYL